MGQSNQLNRIQVTVDSVEQQKPDLAAPRPWSVDEPMLRAFHRLTYQNSVESINQFQVHQFDRQYTAEFWRDSQGYFDIGTQYFVPTVQNVPVFPPTPLAPGQTWSAPGLEVHDLRGGYFNLQEPFRFSMPVTYHYLGTEEKDGLQLELISIEYTVYYPTRLPSLPRTNPRLITGYSSQLLWWDNEQGRPHSYQDEYELSLILNDGTILTFRGTAEARVIDSQPMDRQETVATLEKEIDERNLSNVGVRVTDQGIALVLDNIQFLPDSAALIPGEKTKLDQIGLILDLFPDRDILVTGHTALAGTAQGRQELSQLRAMVVGQYLLDIGARNRDQIMFQGLGAQDPVGDNATEEGRARNRRVEIMILDN